MRVFAHTTHPRQLPPFSYPIQPVPPSPLDGDGGRAAAKVALGGDDLVVVGAELHAHGGPGVKVLLHVDGAGAPLLLADGPVLLKGAGAIDGRLVGARRLGDLVRGAVDVDGALARGLRGRVVRAKVLDHVVLDERVARPPVDGQVRVAVGAVVGRVGDIAGGMLALVVVVVVDKSKDENKNIPSTPRVPPLAADEVAVAGPGDAVGPSGVVGVGGLGPVVGPPGIVEAVVRARGAGGAAPGVEVARLDVNLAHLVDGRRDRVGRDKGGRGGDEDGGEGDHCEVLWVGKQKRDRDFCWG